MSDAHIIDNFRTRLSLVLGGPPDPDGKRRRAEGLVLVRDLDKAIVKHTGRTDLLAQLHSIKVEVAHKVFDLDVLQADPPAVVDDLLEGERQLEEAFNPNPPPEDAYPVAIVYPNAANRPVMRQFLVPVEGLAEFLAVLEKYREVS